MLKMSHHENIHPVANTSKLHTNLLSILILNRIVLSIKIYIRIFFIIKAFNPLTITKKKISLIETVRQVQSDSSG